jgi:hypothetical protein
MIRLFSIGLVLVSMATCVLGQASAAATPLPSVRARLAVISTADTADLAALVTTELSSNPDISLVERDDLAKVGDELKLQQLASSDAVALGKMIGADGLIFISKGPNGLQLRFTAVGLGYALFDDQITSETDLPQLAKSIAHRVAGYAPKLKLDPAKAIPISVLNLRADYATTDSLALERKLTLLLESRLASLPEYVVLERRHAWSLGFEHSLSIPPKPLLQGAYVVDGTLSIPVQSQGAGDVIIHLRLRSPSNQQTPLEIHGPINDLPGLVEQMTAEIQKATGASANLPPWQPQQEAREYLLEGIWGYQHNADDAALEALDTAELLGETAPDLLAVRIPVLCRKVLGSSTANIFYASGPIPDDPHPEEKLGDLTRAFADEARYEKEGMEAKLQVLDHFHSMEGRTGELHKMVDRAGSSLLAMLDHTNNPKAEDVRSALRSFANYDPLNGKLPGDWETAIDFADNWAVSKDEEIAYYRLLMTTYPFADFGAWRLAWKLSPDNFCARFLTSPGDRRAGYFNLFQDLVNNPVSKPLSLYFLATQAEPSQKDGACHALYDYLWDQHESLMQSKHLTYILKYAWQLEQSRKVPVADPKLVALLHYYLQHDDSFTGLEAQMWIPELFPADEAPGLLADLQGYEKRDLRTQHPTVYRDMEASYANHFGSANAGSPTLPPLAVTRFWYAKDAPRRLILATNAISPTPDGLWFAGIIDGIAGTDTAPKGVLYHIAIDSSQPNLFVDPPKRVDAPQTYIQKVVVTSDALYVLSFTRDRPQKTVVDRYDLASGQWDEHEVPGLDQLFEAAGRLYLSLKGLDMASREGGIARYDGQTGEITLLASSRRRPAQNQFDDRAYYRVDNIFTGPGVIPCATIEMKNYFISDQPGQWLPFTQAGLLMRARTEDSRTLLYGPGSYKNASDAAVMVDPAKSNPELWLGPLTPLQVTNAPGSEKLPPPELPAWAKQSLWQQPEGADIKSSDYGFRGDDLFALATHGKETKKVELVWYRRGKADPVRIHLSFQMGDEAINALKAVLSGNSNTLAMVAEPDKTPYVLSMTVVPQGICFKGLIQGFWFLPFSDIDDYLKANSP